MKGSIRHLLSSLLEHDTGWVGFFMLLPKFKIHSTVPKQVTLKNSFCLHLAQQNRKKNIVQENTWMLKKSQMQRTNSELCDRKYYPCKHIEPLHCLLRLHCLLVPLFQETWHLPAGDCHYSFCHYIFSRPFICHLNLNIEITFLFLVYMIFFIRNIKMHNLKLFWSNHMGLNSWELR